MELELDKFDIGVLKRISEGPCFMRHASHEHRACTMRHKGLVTSEMTVYSMSGGGASMNLKNRYTITEAGKSTLEKAIEAGWVPPKSAKDRRRRRGRGGRP